MAAQQSPDERERFIDTIYELFAHRGRNLSEFQTKLFANTRQLLGARSKLDAETKSFIWQTLPARGIFMTRPSSASSPPCLPGFPDAAKRTTPRKEPKHDR